MRKLQIGIISRVRRYVSIKIKYFIDSFYQSPAVYIILILF